MGEPDQKMKFARSSRFLVGTFLLLALAALPAQATDADSQRKALRAFARRRRLMLAELSSELSDVWSQTMTNVVEFSQMTPSSFVRDFGTGVRQIYSGVRDGVRNTARYLCSRKPRKHKRLRLAKTVTVAAA